MEYLVVCVVALLTSGLTLFSGFGLGTLLLPAFLLFFPVDLSVAMTAIVHFLNNLFKLALLGRHAKLKIVMFFGLPAIVAAFGGAAVLMLTSDMPSLTSYELLGKQVQILPVKLLVALLMIAFAIMEILPGLERLQFDQKYLPLGGVLSGFFGGLSGHQGALRSAFLVRAGLSKEAFIATGVVIACLVDVSRLSVYVRHFASSGLQQNTILIIAATCSAFFGAFVGSRLVAKVTMRGIRRVVAMFLFAIALALGNGLI
jgi:hypothetical protein